MGCGKSTNQAAVKRGEVSQPQEMDQSKLKQEQQKEGSQARINKIATNKEHSSQNDKIILLNNQYDKQSHTNCTSYYPNGQPNLAFGKADKFTSSSSKHLYFFGVNQINEQQILRFDIENKKFENVYANLTKEQKENVNIYNYTLCLQIDESTLFLCGGINQQLSEIQSDVYTFNMKTATFTKKQSIITPRYTHFGLVHSNKVYSFGGRTYGDDDQAILRSCEVFDLQSDTWQFHPPMNIPRCTAMTFIYSQTIYVAGGYSGPDQRTKKIEKFNPKTSQWDILDFKLHRGLEGSFFLGSKLYNELLVFGGYSRGGATSSIASIDLAEKSVRYKGNMVKERVLHKGVVQGDNVYVFGGDEANNVEKIDLNSYASSLYHVKPNFTDFCDQFEIEKYSAVFQTQEVDFYAEVNQSENVNQASKLESNEEKKEDKITYHLLGTDDQPFLMQFCGTSSENVIVKSVPTNLELSCYQGGCRISQNELFLAGGISFSMSQVFNKSFIYNTKERKMTKLAPMINQRYAFSCVYLKEQQEIYVIGGRSYQNLGGDGDDISIGDASKDDPNLMLSNINKYDPPILTQNKQNEQNMKNSSLFNNRNPKEQASMRSMHQSQLQNKSNINQKESQLLERNSQMPSDGDVLVYCEKLDLKNKKWISIDQLKRPRSSASTFVYLGKIYVYGKIIKTFHKYQNNEQGNILTYFEMMNSGYHGEGGDIYKSVNMESYDTKTNKWEEHAIKFDTLIPSIEASQIMISPDNSNKFLIFGGQIEQKASNKIWELDIQKLEQIEISQMKVSRFLHKIATIHNEEDPHKQKIIILGGNKDSLIEFYCQNKSVQQSESDEQQIISDISNILLKNIGDQLMKKYLFI